MRWTGLRVGELIHLEFDCIRTDHRANRFIKVPLGKLYNERLVPIDEAAYQLITKLQKAATRKATASFSSPRPGGRPDTRSTAQN